MYTKVVKTIYIVWEDMNTTVHQYCSTEEEVTMPGKQSVYDGKRRQVQIQTNFYPNKD